MIYYLKEAGKKVKRKMEMMYSVSLRLFDWQYLVCCVETWLVLIVLHTLALEHLQGQILIHSTLNQ